MLSWADYAIIAVCVASAAFGFWRGFTREALSLATWLAAIFVAWKFGWAVEPMLEQWIEAPAARLWVARALVLVLVLLAGGLIAWLVRQVIRHTVLNGLDRLLGVLFGFARGALIVGLAVIGLQLSGLDQDPWWQQSRLKPVADRVADGIRYYGSLGGAYLRDQQII